MDKRIVKYGVNFNKYVWVPLNPNKYNYHQSLDHAIYKKEKKIDKNHIDLIIINFQEIPKDSRR
jgi:hypothetical protein